MNRSAKRHRSTKVPNVKLRPAPSKEESLSEDKRAEQEAWRHYTELKGKHASGKRKAIEDETYDSKHGSDDDDHQSDGENDDECAPLAGCVICTTGFSEEKVQLQECASVLGAVFEGNLTDAATHLIASETGSDKYYWAIKMGIPVLRPHWLYHLRDKWQKAESIDYEALLQEHRLDAFEGLTIAMAGVTDVNRRKQIRDQVKLASGMTPTVFKLDGSFTHLLCQDIKSSETHKAVERFLHKANRYRKRGEDIPDNAPDAEQMRAALKLKMVWMEWLEDSLAVDGCIEERLYAIGEPRMNESHRQRLVKSIQAKQAERKALTAKRMQACRSNTAKASDADVAVVRTKESERADEKLRPLTKRAKGGLSELVQHLTSEKVSLAPVIAKASPMPEVTDEEKASSKGWHSSKTSSKTADETGKVCEAESEESTTVKDQSLGEFEADERSGLFDQSLERNLQDMVFRIDLRDDGKNARVREALNAYGIKRLLEAGDAQRADYHILPLGKVDVSEGGHLGQPITHFFIERCMIEDRALRLDESFALRPAIQRFPLQGCENITVALTGLGSNEDGPDRHQVELALDTAGIKVESTLKKGVSTHLLVGKKGGSCSNAQAKIARAKEWGIPVMGTDFVERIFRQGVEEALHTVDTTANECSNRNEAQSSKADTLARPLHDRKASTTWQRSSSDGEKVFGNVLRPAPSAETRARGSEPPTDHRAQQRIDTERMEMHGARCKTGAAVIQQTKAIMKEKSFDDVDRDGSVKGGVVMSRAQLSSSTNGRKTRRLAPSARNRAGRTSRTPTREERAPSMASDLSDVSNLFNGGADARNADTDIHALMMQHSMLNPYTLSPAETPTEESLRVVYDDPVARRERRKLAALISNGKNNDDESQSDASPQKQDQENGSRHSKHIASRTETMTKVRSADFTPSIKARRQPGTAQRDL